MCKVLWFFGAILAFLVVAMVAIGYAQTQTGCYEPCHTCPDVVCPQPPVCPDVNVTCNCEVGAIELPGLYEMSIKGHKRCGAITIIGSSFLFDGEWTGLGINKIKFATPVGSCE